MKSISKTREAEAVKLWDLVMQKKHAALQLLNLGLHNDSLSRTYYAAFHAVTLLFFLENRSFSSHKQLIGNFNKEYIHQGVFDERLGRALTSLFELRQSGDYDYHVQFDCDEAQEGIEKLNLILDTIRKYVQAKWYITLS